MARRGARGRDSGGHFCLRDLVQVVAQFRGRQGDAFDKFLGRSDEGVFAIGLPEINHFTCEGFL